MTRFNLSDWALNHRSLVWYLMLVAALAGVLSYVSLGREEDPNFTIKEMIVTASWPGASPLEVANELTDRIEKKLEELPELDFTESQSLAGQSIVYVTIKDSVQGDRVRQTWLKVRNMLGDIKGDLPDGVEGPYFNDDFGDVYGNIYAFTADGISQRQLRDYVEAAKLKLTAVENVGKIRLIGAQDEKIYLEFSTRQMANLGVTQSQIVDALAAQNAVSPSGIMQADGERISIRTGGAFTDEASLSDVNLWVNDRYFRLSDVAKITRGYEDPPDTLFRYRGQPAIGLAVGMVPGANLLKFGQALDAELAKVQAELPVGAEMHLVSDQPTVVKDAVGHFTRALFEAIVIVLAVSFVSLGLRAGLIVALSIPLVLAITFVVMDQAGISLQRISLGALIIALGLLVDDAMIAVEMMVSKLEEGASLREAATAVYTTTAFPMLTGTLVTVASYMPVGLNSSSAGEFTFTLFVVVAVSLVTSWVVAVLFTPLLGVTFLRAGPAHGHGADDHSPGPLRRGFRRLLVTGMRHRRITIALTLAAFALAVFGMGHVQQQFFPSSDRTEIIVDWTAPQNASILRTRDEMDRFEAGLKDDPDVRFWSSYVGEGAWRFILAFNVLPQSPSTGQIVIQTPDLAARNRLMARLQARARAEFPGSDVFVHLLDIGPPVGRPVQYRLSGPDIATLRQQALALGALMGANPDLGPVTYNWMEPARVVQVKILQDKARQLGITSQDVAGVLSGIVGGTTATQIRDDTYLVDVIARARAGERDRIETLENLQINTSSGSFPLAAIATFGFTLEQPVIWRRDRMPTITLRAPVATPGLQPDTIVKALSAPLAAYSAALPAGYRLETAGAVEESGKAQGPITKVVPLMLVAMFTLLMVQLQSFQRLFIVMAVAPLGLIGVVIALLGSGAPMGFVAILGILALIGILIRNSVILVIQIEALISSGMDRWQAVIRATEQRMRPILLTAAAASFALIPISREVFWGPMAYAMIGGILVGTALTLVFLPALYVSWFGIRPAPAEATQEPPTP